jgi:hypothetical protein
MDSRGDRTYRRILRWAQALARLDRDDSGVRTVDRIWNEDKAVRVRSGLDGFLSGLLAESARMEGKPVICGTCSSVRTSAWEPCRGCGEVD